MAPRPELIPKRALLLFPDSEQMLVWRESLQYKGINALDFCLAFNFKQALTLVKYFQKDPSLKVVVGDAGMLGDRTAAGAEEFFKLLEAQSYTLLTSISEKTYITPVKAAVLKHLRGQNPNRFTREKTKRSAAHEKVTF